MKLTKTQLIKLMAETEGEEVDLSELLTVDSNEDCDGFKSQPNKPINYYSLMNDCKVEKELHFPRKYNWSKMNSVEKEKLSVIIKSIIGFSDGKVYENHYVLSLLDLDECVQDKVNYMVINILGESFIKDIGIFPQLLLYLHKLGVKFPYIFAFITRGEFVEDCDLDLTIGELVELFDKVFKDTLSGVYRLNSYDEIHSMIDIMDCCRYFFLQYNKDLTLRETLKGLSLLERY